MFFQQIGSSKTSGLALWEVVTGFLYFFRCYNIHFLIIVLCKYVNKTLPKKLFVGVIDTTSQEVLVGGAVA